MQSESLDMHLRFEQLGSVFAVEKPSHTDGARTLSFQFYDRRGDSAFKVFLTFANISRRLRSSSCRFWSVVALESRFSRRWRCNERL